MRNHLSPIRRFIVSIMLCASAGSFASLAEARGADDVATTANVSRESLASIRSTRAPCTEAAREALARAEAAGIARDRMQWLYGRKPFDGVGHVSLVVDGFVVDNGGLGVDLWGQRVCPGNVCNLDEARRALDESFLAPIEAGTDAPMATIDIGQWRGRVAASR